MDTSLSRPKRIRVKPLRFWDNERVKYNIHGQIIDTTVSSFASFSKSENSSSSRKKKVNNTNISVLKKNGKQNESVNSKTFQVIKEKSTNLSVVKKNGKQKESMPLKTSQAIKEKPSRKKKDIQNIKNHKSSEGGKRRDTSNTSKIEKSLPKSLSRPDITNSSKKNDSANVLKNSSELDKLKKPTTNPKKGRKIQEGTLSSLIEKDKEPNQNYPPSELKQDPTDICRLKYVVDGYNVFEMKEMYLLRNNLGEEYYGAKAIIDSETGLRTGYLCFKGQQFHYDSGLTKDIIVVRGEGSIEFTQNGTGQTLSEPLFKGAKFHVAQGDEILLRKNEDSPIVILFLSFKLN